MVIFTTNYKQLKTMNIPENLLFTQDHEWISVEWDLAVVGISDYAQGELGDVVFVEIETLGETLGKGDIFGTVEAVKTVSDLFMVITAGLKPCPTSILTEYDSLCPGVTVEAGACARTGPCAVSAAGVVVTDALILAVLAVS